MIKNTLAIQGELKRRSRWKENSMDDPPLHKRKERRAFWGKKEAQHNFSQFENKYKRWGTFVPRNFLTSDIVDLQNPFAQGQTPACIFLQALADLHTEGPQSQWEGLGGNKPPPWEKVCLALVPWPDSSPSPLKAWFPHQQCWNHLGAGQKGSIAGPPWEQVNQKMDFHKYPRSCVRAIKFEITLSVRDSATPLNCPGPWPHCWFCPLGSVPSEFPHAFLILGLSNSRVTCLPLAWVASPCLYILSASVSYFSYLKKQTNKNAVMTDFNWMSSFDSYSRCLCGEDSKAVYIG